MMSSKRRIENLNSEYYIIPQLGTFQLNHALAAILTAIGYKERGREIEFPMQLHRQFKPRRPVMV